MIVNGFPRDVKIYTDQISGLSAITNSTSQITLSWVNPTSKKFVGVMIRYKVGSYPSSPTDGTLAYFGTGTSVVVSGLANGVTFYFRAFAKATNTSGSKVYYNTNTDWAQVAKATRAAAGQVVLTSSQTWVVPPGVSVVDIFLVGGGGGTSFGYISSNDFLGGFGACGGGYTRTQKNVSCTPGSSVPVVVGAGGSGLANRNDYGRANGGKGGTSSVTINGITHSAEGGNAPQLGNMGSASGASGGSGGGGGTMGSTGQTITCGSGGADGSGGGNATMHGGYVFSYGGSGQGSTTRAFAEIEATLYAGGGGGGFAPAGATGSPGGGGAGGGGYGGYFGSYIGSGGTPNTGGGAGCPTLLQGPGSMDNPYVTNGGSGVVIIRWAEQ